MKKKLFLLAFIPFFLMGCNKNNNQSSSPQSSSEEEIRSLIKLSETSIYIPEDRTYQLGLEIDESLKDYLVFWNIRDEDIATVEDGLITAKKVGNTICTVQVGTYTARCAVNVTNYEPEENMGLSVPPKGKHIFGMVRVGEKGQIVIPSKARKIFNIEPGDQLIILGDEGQGLAVVKAKDFLKLADLVRNL